MIDLYKKILISQFEASLSMARQCVEACKPQHWDGKIANDTFRQVIYHVLFFTDLYLSADETGLEDREFHKRGGNERGPHLSPGLGKEDTLAYIPIIRRKVIDTLSAETEESLNGPSGFSWRKFTRAE